MDEVATIQTGISKSQNRTGPSVVCPYLRVANVQDGYLDLAEIKEIQVPAHMLERYSLHYGDVLLTEGGDFDKLGRGHVWHSQIPNCVHQNHIFAVRPNPKRLIPEFLAALTQSRWGRMYFLGCSKQSTNLASINSSQLKAFPVPLPSLPEQRRIAELFGVWDSAIADLQELIDAKTRRKEALIQKLLTGAVRLPGFNRPWAEKRFEDHLQESRILGSDGKSARKLTIKLYGKGVIAKKGPRDGSTQTRYFIRRSGQFIYSKLDFLNGAFGIVPVELDGYESTLDLPAFDLMKDVDPQWLLYTVSRPEFYTRCLGAADGGRKARRVNPSAFLRMKIMTPLLEEQRAIAQILANCDREIYLLSRQLDCIRTQKRGLMEQLFTGRIRCC